jgi:hypothetical protein
MNAIDPRMTVPSDCRLAASTPAHPSLARAGAWLGRVALAAAPAALSLAALANAGCSASVEAPRTAPGPTGAAACHVTGGPAVLARRVFVPGGVQVSDEGGSLSVRFATARSRCVAVDWPSASPASPTACPVPGARTAERANQDDETMLAWESTDTASPHIELGVVTYDTPQTVFGFATGGRRRVVERPFYTAESGRDSETAPALAPIGHDRFLLAWVDGNVETNRLRAQSVVGWGDPLGPAMVLSPSDATVIGQPSVAVAPTGYGVVTYIAAVQGEFDVLATPIACAMN